MKAGWEIKLLSELSEVITKGTTPTSVGFKFLEKGVNFVKIESISENGKFIKEKFAYISTEAHKALKRSKLKEGDILFSIAGALGRTAIVTNDILPANTNQALSIIRLKENPELLTNYVFSALTSGYALEQINNLKGGVAQQNLSLGQMKSFQIPIPPLTEQKQIVAILDKAFAAIDQAIANIEKNIQNAQELFQSKLNEIFSQKGEGWEEEIFDNVISSSLIGLVRNSKQQSNEFSFRYFKMSNIKNENGMDESKFTYIEASTDEVNKYSLKNGDFLFNTRNSYELVGKTCVYKSTYKAPVLFNNNILRVKFKDFLLSEFVAYAFCSPKVKSDLENMKSGTTSVVGIYYKSLKNLKIPIAPVQIQKEIVHELELFENQKDCVINIFKNKLASLDELKKSILQKAFAGELTENKEYHA
ncbi:type I restriction endonuclease EcoKI subunit S [Marinicella pacifica]|uniref:Type I restriction endonuclease EcoKI subunit S n=1 Tax=Marinicella pacifica TaxID=1171543 RepID=A0A917CE63_9GAMM|nr:restriction endonuclease subunit S [Marinicella pacifica]GGF84638.1 type I restriction endonuclease EcoKI subunit S [Marinicella pacifica]